MRFIKQNMILVSLLPGEKQSSFAELNRMLQPMVKELLTLHIGKLFNTYQYPKGRTVRALLLQVCCDSPAARKVGGFGVVTHCCNKCNLQLQSFTATNSIQNRPVEVSPL